MWLHIRNFSRINTLLYGRCVSVYHGGLFKSLPVTNTVNDGNYNKEWRRYYKNFGHQRPEPMPLISKIWYTIIVCGVFLPFVNYKALRNIFFPSVEAASEVADKKAEVVSANDNSDSDVDEDAADGEDTKKKKKKEKIGFRDRKIVVREL